jgi:hypothetical protein
MSRIKPIGARLARATQRSQSKPLERAGPDLLEGHKRDMNTLKALCVESKTHEFAISTRSFWKILRSRVLRLRSRVF